MCPKGVCEMSRYSNEFKSQILKEIEETGSVNVVAKKHGLIPRSVHNWVNAVNNADQIAEKKQVRELQKLVQKQELKIEVLTSLLKKTYQVWNSDDKLS
jgi:transposase-like protein